MNNNLTTLQTHRQGVVGESWMSSWLFDSLFFVFDFLLFWIFRIILGTSLVRFPFIWEADSYESKSVRWEQCSRSSHASTRRKRDPQRRDGNQLTRHCRYTFFLVSLSILCQMYDGHTLEKQIVELLKNIRMNERNTQVNYFHNETSDIAGCWTWPQLSTFIQSCASWRWRWRRSLSSPVFLSFHNYARASAAGCSCLAHKVLLQGLFWPVAALALNASIITALLESIFTAGGTYITGAPR